jgi:two-component system NarL family sensor kinase
VQRSPPGTEHATEEVDRAIRDLRNYIFGLRPGILADRQLDQALRQLAIEFQERTGVLTVARIDEQVAAELAGRSADLVQLVREALSNVGRHAEATSCSVTLRRSQRGAELEIDDDGRGFDPSNASSGMGIRNLRDRAASLGGVLAIDSVGDQGTTVVARIPL